MAWPTSTISHSIPVLDAQSERCANVCFGGPKHNRLFMAASQSL
jgi:sugar lactone lactonase YvrE